MTSAALLSAMQSDVEQEGVRWDASSEAPALQAIMARRRSIRRLHGGPFPSHAKERLLEAIRAIEHAAAEWIWTGDPDGRA